MASNSCRMTWLQCSKIAFRPQSKGLLLEDQACILMSCSAHCWAVKYALTKHSASRRHVRTLWCSLTDIDHAVSPCLSISVLQTCRPDLLPTAMHRFVSTTLGPSFADPSAARLSDVYADSSATTPIILTVAQGADAMTDLGAFAAGQGRAVGRGLQLLSLGQGQGPVAEALVRLAMRNGDWVCLQVRQLCKEVFGSNWPKYGCNVVYANSGW